MYIESVAATFVGIVSLTLMRRFEDKDNRVRRRLALTISEGGTTADELISKFRTRDVLATLEGWSRDTSGAVRQLTFSVRLAPDTGEQALVAILEAEPEIVKMQLDPAH
jgi:hypothetical protein